MATYEVQVHYVGNLTKYIEAASSKEAVNIAMNTMPIIDDGQQEIHSIYVKHRPLAKDTQ